jgi:hypothetical protein
MLTILSAVVFIGSSLVIVSVSMNHPKFSKGDIKFIAAWAAIWIISGAYLFGIW